MRNLQIKQQILFAIAQELKLNDQALQDACYFFSLQNLGIKFYHFLCVREQNKEPKYVSIEIEHDLIRIKPQENVEYITKLDFFILDAIMQMKENGFQIPIRQETNPAGKEGLWTVGYEGLGIDEYINKLLNAGVCHLVDVRGNAYSNKFGFSKNELSLALKRVGISYTHIPELGINQETKPEGATLSEIFEEYEKSLLLKSNAVQKFLEIYKIHKSLAITCFEKDAENCHRSRLAKFLKLNFEQI